MEAFLKAVAAAAAGVWNADQVHKVGEVPDNPKTPYNSVSVSSPRAETYLLSAQHGSQAYRIAVQSIGATSGEVGFAVDKADAALLDRSLDVAGFDCTPCISETSSPIIRDPDGGGLLSCTLTYTFSAYPKE